MDNNETVISADVLRFIEQCIDSVPHLEALLLIWESAPQSWTNSELAARIYVAPDLSQKIIRDLERRRFIERQKADRSGYTYCPENEYADLLPLVARAYQRQLVAITRLIHSKASLAVREFSKAFRFKRDQ